MTLKAWIGIVAGATVGVAAIVVLVAIAPGNWVNPLVDMVIAIGVPLAGAIIGAEVAGRVS